MPPFNNDIEMIRMIGVVGHSSMKLRCTSTSVCYQLFNRTIRLGKKMSKID